MSFSFHLARVSAVVGVSSSPTTSFRIFAITQKAPWSKRLAPSIIYGSVSLAGGKLSVYVNLCEKTRQEVYQLMIDHANEAGANAILNMRYDANEVMQGVTEVLAYGTAVVVEKS